jgi:predicted phage terminase large subunit-like protein
VPIRPLNRDRDKITRASERQGYVESGQLHLPAQDGTIRSDFRVVFDEMTTFPVGGHDDTVDAVIDLIELTANMGAPLEAARIGNAKKNPRDIYGIKSKKW